MSSTLNPARSKLDLALSEFSKARWATEPSVDAPLQPTDLDWVASAPSSPGKQASFALARFLIAFCIGVAATLAWQSYGDATRKMIASSSPQPAWSAPQAAPEAATRGIEAGGFVVQLSAARSEPEAQAAFRTMQAKYSVLSGRQPLIRRKDLLRPEELTDACLPLRVARAKPLSWTACSATNATAACSRSPRSIGMWRASRRRWRWSGRWVRARPEIK
jgi:hypothetical protein